MDHALYLATSNIGKTSPNPSVGAVIVKNNEIISTGITMPCGGDHGEIVAIKEAKDQCKGADLYVTLEPCSHHGKTPPCVDAIIREGFKRVFIAVLDPNPLVAGNGLRMLNEAGIKASLMPEYMPKAADLIRPFKKMILRKKPFVIHKTAITLDGRIATSSGSSQWISDEYSRYFVHRLRNKCDAILVGKNTFIADDPSLNVRIIDFNSDVKSFYDQDIKINGRENVFLKNLLQGAGDDVVLDPLRIIVGLPEVISPDAKACVDDNYLFFDFKNSADKKHKDFNIYSKKIDDPAEQIHEILDVLYKRGVMTIMMEGGSHISGSFLDAGEIDQFFYTISPKILGSGLSAVTGYEREKMSEAYELHETSFIHLKNDLLYNGYKEMYNFEMM